MEREILFRGKLICNGEWAYGNLKVTKQDTAIITPDDTILGVYSAVIPETVGQFTGLTDKNGVKIFEGDIIKISNDIVNESEIGKVVWCSECGLFFVKLDTWKTTFDLDSDWYYEVIGNIHDNPELLEYAGDVAMDIISQPVMQPTFVDNFELSQA